MCTQESFAKKRLEQGACQTPGQALGLPIGQVSRIRPLKPLLFKLSLVDLLDLVVQGLEGGPRVCHALFAVTKRRAPLLWRRADKRRAVV